ncbi:MAG: tetratricopeptide repeat protein [Planctomycetota bacterium]
MRAILAVVLVLLASPHRVLGQPSAGDRALRTANALLQRGLHAEASAEYEAALRSLGDPGDRDQARYGLAVASYRLGRDEPALRALEAIERPRRFEFRADADVLRVHVLFRMKRYADAAEAAGDALRHEGHGSWASIASLRVESLHRAGRHWPAVEAYDDAAGRLSRDDGDAALRRRASFFAGLAQQAVARTPADHARAAGYFEAAQPPRGRDEIGDLARVRQAYALRDAGRTDDAIAAFERAIRRGGERTTPEALLGLGGLLRSAGRPAESTEILRTLSEREGGYRRSRVQYELGLALLEMGDADEAAQALRRAARDATTDLADDIDYWRAKADLRRGRADDAAQRLAEFADAFDESNLIAEARYDLGVALERSGRGDDATRAFDRFRRAHPDHAMAPDALYAMASLALAEGRIDRAASHAEAFVRAHGDHPLAGQAGFVLGEALFRQGDHERAAGVLQPLADEDGELGRRASYRLGLSLRELGRADEAETYLARVASGGDADEAFLPALLARGEIAFERGDWDAAIEAFDGYLDSADDGDESAGDALMKRGLAYARSERPREALGDFGRVLEDHAGGVHGAHARFEVAQAHLALGDDTSARAALRGLLDEHEGSKFEPYALRHLAGIAARAGDPAEAADLYERAAASGDAGFARSFAVERARALLDAGDPRAAAGLLEGLDGEATTWRVIALARLGAHGDAIELARGHDAPAVESDVGELYFYELGGSLRATGEDAGARRLFERLAGRGDAIGGRAALDLADMLIDAKQFDAAAETLRGALTHDALDAELCPSILYKLAWCEYQLGDHRRVVALLDEPRCELGSLKAPAAMVLGESQLALGRGKPAAAAFGIVLADEASRDLHEAALLRLGEAHAAAQDWRASRRAYEDHRSRHAKSPQWFRAEFGLGWARENAGEHREAIAHYRAVTERHDGETAARAQFQLGECLFALGEFDEAVRELLRVDILYASPTWSAAALYEAGRCFESMDKVGEARAQYRAVRERFAESPWAQAAGERLAAIAGPGGSGG